MNILTQSPPDIRNAMFFYLSGTELCAVRAVDKKTKHFIENFESKLYKDCTRCEFPDVFKSYFFMWPYRTDWKNIYILATQVSFAHTEITNLNNAVFERKRFEVLEMILVIVETALSFLTVTVNVAKVGQLGWAPARAAIRAFMKANPHLTIREVYEALGIVAKEAIPLIT